MREGWWDPLVYNDESVWRPFDAGTPNSASMNLWRKFGCPREWPAGGRGIEIDPGVVFYPTERTRSG